MKELDVLLERYLDRHYASADAAERAQLDELLDCEDPELQAWCFRRAEPPAHLRSLIDKLTTAA